MLDETWYKFNPLSSITAYELAQILMTTELTISQGVLDRMPKECKKHFHLTQHPEQIKDFSDVDFPPYE